MSFLNTIRGLGSRTNKKKKDVEFYSHPNGSGTPGSPVRRSQSPSKASPTKRSNHSPTRRRRGLPTKAHATLNQASQGPHGSQVAHAGQHRQPAPSLELPLFMCEPFVKTSLVKGSFKTIVQLPKYVDYGEWIALNIFEMFNNLNQFYKVLVEYITPEAYPTMNAGPNTNYLWVDGSGQPINLPAAQYIDYVLTWISNKLNDQSVFPTKSGGAFPPNFIKDCKNISRQMFRIFAHIYHNHFDKIVHLSLEAHWNSFFAHYVSFIKEFKLVDRNELEPLLPLIENFEEQGKII